MRKKPEGSPPYKETWYIFGAELSEEESPEGALVKWLKDNVGIEVDVKERLGWDWEVKVDHDQKEKVFVYLDVLLDYKSGTARTPEGAEKIAWIPIDGLSKYDVVPPSVTLFKKLGYLSD